jgi:hypothetical protein
VRYAFLATGLLALVARVAVLTDGGTLSNLTLFAVFMVSAMGYLAISIID